MNPIVENPSTVLVEVWSNMPDSERIPKFIELYDKSLKAVWSKWNASNEVRIDGLKPGAYTLRLSLSSGVQKDECIDLEPGEVKTVVFDIGNRSPHESHEWAYFSKNLAIPTYRGMDMKSNRYESESGKQVNGRLWKYVAGTWQQELIPVLMNQMIYGDGHTFRLNTGEELSLLEISGEDMPNLYVSLPPSNTLNCLVKLAEAGNEEAHALDVTVSTENFKAETLLTLLTNGAIREAQALGNALEAEELLYRKFVNPVTAAIGGYFLLKIGELSRLHDWAHNLAQEFKRLPDGAVIHATQLLNKPEKTDAEIMLIRSRLLEAVDRGLPVYSEGLRLLEKGLTQLWYHTQQTDEAVKAARAKVGEYLEAADLSQETTTFVGISPSEPGRYPLVKSGVKAPVYRG